MFYANNNRKLFFVTKVRKDKNSPDHEIIDIIAILNAVQLLMFISLHYIPR